MESPHDKVERLHALIEGHVQGVGYRYFAMERAQRLRLTGWVRNLATGEVEVEAEGSTSDLELFLEELKRGPAGSSVRQVKEEWNPATAEDYTFRVRIYD